MLMQELLLAVGGCCMEDLQGKGCSFNVKETTFATARSQSALGRFCFLNVFTLLVETQYGRVQRKQWLSTCPTLSVSHQVVQQHHCKRSEAKPGTVGYIQADTKSWPAISCFVVGVSPGWKLAAGFKNGEEKGSAET